MNVGIYCRLSIEDRNKLKNDDSRSIQNQKLMLCDYCRERNWDIFDIYCDDGYSGTDRSRPEFNRLLDDCENGCIDVVLCKDQSRFSRDVVVIEQFINDRFIEWGVRFIGVSDNSDTESEMYGAMRLFTSAYNEMYVRDISCKIRRTLAYKREHGQFVGSFAPYGYRIDSADRHHLVIDGEAAENVRRIFEIYIQGGSYRKIVEELNSNGIPSPSAYKKMCGVKYVNCNAENGTSFGLWTQSTVAAILRNEVYTGTLVQGKSHHISYKNKKRKKVCESGWIRTLNAHEAIIDAETWEYARKRLECHARTSRISKEIPPLSGKVKCAVCGRSMNRNVYYNKDKTVQYYGLQCADYKKGTMKCMNHRTLSGRVLEKAVTDELNKIAELYCRKDKLELNNADGINIQSFEQKLGNLKQQLQIAEKRLEKMYFDKLDGKITEDEYIKFREKVNAEKHGISVKIAEIGRYSAENDEKPDFEKLKEKFTHFSSLNRRICDEFVDCIEVGEVDGNGRRELKIHWKI